MIEEDKARKILGMIGINVPQGFVINQAGEIEDNVDIEPFRKKKLVVKALVKIGGRGKGGGIKTCQGLKKALKTAKKMIGMELSTTQGKETVEKALIVEYIPVEREKQIFLSFVLNKNKEKPVVLVSPKGGEDIEQEKEVLEIEINPWIGLRDYEIRKMAQYCNVGKSILQFALLVKKLYQLFAEKQMLLLEINPLGLTSEGELIPLDIKMEFDNSYLPAFPLLDPEISSVLELNQKSKRYRYYRVKGDEGNIGVIAHGAGMALAIIDQHNFNGMAMRGFVDLDVGADMTPESFAQTVKSAVGDDEFILGNIYGGVMGLFLITDGLLQAAAALPEKKMVFRLEGLERKLESEQKELLAPLKGLKNLYVFYDFEEAINKLKELTGCNKTKETETKKQIQTAEKEKANQPEMNSECLLYHEEIPKEEGQTLPELMDGNIIVQGLGQTGRLHMKRMTDFYQTNVVAGVAPGKGGQEIEGIPVFERVEEADAAVGPISATVIFVPALLPTGNYVSHAAEDAVIEAVDAGVPLIVWITERVPQWDVCRVKSYIKANAPRTILIGPNSPGLVWACRVKLGFFQGYLFEQDGDIAVFSRSGSLLTETTLQLQKVGLNVGLAIGIGGDPIIGMNFVDCLKIIREIPSIKAAVLTGEIGPNFEQKACDYIIETGFPKPVLFYIAGTTAPLGRSLGHAGARIEERAEATDKVKYIETAGLTVCLDILEVGRKMKELLEAKK